MSVLVACVIYVAAFVVANLSVAAFGPWVSPINAFVLIGLDLTLRDRLHDVWQTNGLWVRMNTLILTAGLLSYWLNPAAGRIALASFVAFVLAAIADSIAYAMLRRKQYHLRVNGSNAAGAAVDSVVFPTLAFGVFLPEIVALQFAAKVGGGFLWALALRRTKLNGFWAS